MKFECHFGKKLKKSDIFFDDNATKNQIYIDENNLFYCIFTKTEKNNHAIHKSSEIFVFFNGILFNKKNLAEEYKIYNYTSESELILELYLLNGADLAKHLDGFFCFIIFDPKSNTVFAANDHIGSENMYIYNSSNHSTLSSDIKTLRNTHKLNKINQKRVETFFDFIHPESNETFFENILQLSAFEMLELKKDNVLIKPYATFNVSKYKHLSSEEDFMKEYKKIFTESVANCMETSQSKIGTALSGGLDSSSITSKACELGFKEIHSYTATFESLEGNDYKKTSELEYAKAVSRKWHHKHHLIDISNNGALTQLKENIDFLDEPDLLINGYIHQTIFKKMNKHKNEIFLDGFGGDSVISHGYNYLHQLGKTFQLYQLLHESKHLFKKNNKKVPYFAVLRQYFFMNIIPEYLHWLIKTNIGNLPQQVKWLKRMKKNRSSLLNKIKEFYGFYPFRYSKSANYLHLKDVSNPIIGLSVRAIKNIANKYNIDIRFPFLSKELIELSLATPVKYKLKNGVNRSIFRESFRDILPNKVYKRITKSDLSPLSLKELSKISAKDLEELIKNQNVDFFNIGWIKYLSKSPKNNMFEIYQIYSFLKWLEHNSIKLNH
tara:strand:+ start:2333 stop:4156 length:1824 start_codon:yes stop_codon:yes gene_type:complete